LISDLKCLEERKFFEEIVQGRFNPAYVYEGININKSSDRHIRPELSAVGCREGTETDPGQEIQG
jgi:hypothetical protein